MDKFHNLITSVAFCFIVLLVSTMSREVKAQDNNNPPSMNSPNAAQNKSVTPSGVVLLDKKVGFPIVITQPGSFSLKSNLTVPANTNGIVIAADNVTIDLNGFSIIGSGSGDGITLDNAFHKGITVRNGNITNFVNGINLSSSTQCNIEQMHVYSNSKNGIVAGFSTIVTGNITADNTFDGIEVGQESIVSRNISSGNGNIAISVAQTSTISGNNASGNLGVGLQILCPVNIIENTALDNQISLNAVINGNGCTFANNNFGP